MPDGRGTLAARGIARGDVAALRLVGLDDVRGPAEHEVVDDAEHRRVGADREAERDHGHGDEGGIAPQTAHRVAHVLAEGVEGRAALRIAAFFLGAPHAAELAQHASSRFVLGQPSAHVMRRGVVEMKRELLVDLRVEAATMQHGVEAIPERVHAPHHHHRCSPGRVCARRPPLLWSACRQSCR